MKKQSKKKSSNKGKSSDKKGKISSGSKRKDKKTVKEDEGKESRRSGIYADQTNRNNFGSVEKSKLDFLVEKSENTVLMPGQ